MSTRFEGADAASTNVTVVPAGTTVGGEIITTPALVFAYDEVFYVTGSFSDLRSMLTHALDDLHSMLTQALDGLDTVDDDDHGPGCDGPLNCTCSDTPARRVRLLARSYDDAGADDLADIAEFRYALVERNCHGSDPGHWISGHDTPDAAGRYHYNQESPEDWEIVELVDLTTGDRFEVGEVTTTWNVRPA